MPGASKGIPKPVPEGGIVAIHTSPGSLVELAIIWYPIFHLASKDSGFTPCVRGVSEMVNFRIMSGGPPRLGITFCGELEVSNIGNAVMKPTARRIVGTYTNQILSFLLPKI